MQKNESELLFDNFCLVNNLQITEIKTSDSPRPDYNVILGHQNVIVELKQINKDTNFTIKQGVRTVGAHIRKKIGKASKQVKTALAEGNPAILLIYNNLDPLQLFGTETHDFVTAMYGEMTVELTQSSPGISRTYYGQNKKMRKDSNTSFITVGHLYSTKSTINVKIIENVYADNELEYSTLPACVEAIRINIQC